MNSCNFINNANNGVRLNIASSYFPVHGDTANNALTYAYMKNGETNNVLSGVIQNMPIYSGCILPSTGVDVTTASRDSLLTAFTFGFQFDKSISDSIDLDGRDTGSLGSAITIQMNENYNPLFPSSVNGNMTLNTFVSLTKHLHKGIKFAHLLF